MRVAYFINQYPKVSHSFIRNEILALERLGVDVVRLSLRGWDETLVDADDLSERTKTRYILRGGLLALLPALMLQCLRTPMRMLKALGLAHRLARQSDRPLPYHWIYLAEACEVVRLLRGQGVAHVHAHFGTNSAEVVMLAHTLGGPRYSFTVHGPDEFDRPLGFHLREKVEQAAAVIAVSSFGRSQLYRWADHAHWDKIKVVHCGLSDTFRRDATAIPFPEEPRLVCVGRLCEQKGQLLLLQAASILRKQGCQFQLVLAGDGEMRSDLERYIQTHELKDRVTITGWISSQRVRDEILSARAMVLPSFAEGLPVVIMEAMALGRPVISTYIAGIPELVRDGTDGWLVPAGDVDALVKALAELLATPTDDLREMGAIARLRATGRHSIDVEAAKLLEHFKGPA
jgi:glycosyltransferase involved in cell wall biosynthesis